MGERDPKSADGTAEGLQRLDVTQLSMKGLKLPEINVFGRGGIKHTGIQKRQCVRVGQLKRPVNE